MLSVLWDVKEGEALKLSEVHRRLSERRAHYGEPAPALTSVSSTLRAAVARGLLTEMRLIGGTPVEVSRGGRAMLHATRSPHTAYVAAHAPGAVLLPVFRTLTEAYPPALRSQALLDMARALDLPEDVRHKIEKLIP